MAFDRNLNLVWTHYKPRTTHPGRCHMIVAADIDEDGKDEVITGGLCFEGDGSVRWERKIGHCDLVYAADVRPSEPGMEILYAIEQGFRSDPQTGAMLLDKDGNVLWYSKEFGGSGAGGWAANVREDLYGLEFYIKYDRPEGWKHRLYSANGEVIGSTGFGSTPYDWDGDNKADFYTPKEVANGKWWSHTRADIIGDYRDEIIAYNVYEGILYVFTNNNMNPNGKKPSPWENRHYAIYHRIGSDYWGD